MDFPPAFGQIADHGELIGEVMTSGLVLQASAGDPHVDVQFNRVTTMLDHPSALARPQTLLRAPRWKLLPGTT